MADKKLRTICAWCKTLIHDGDTTMLFGIERVSHGMCLDCYNNWENTQKKLWDDSIAKEKEKVYVELNQESDKNNPPKRY